MDFGERLKALRKEKGITQEELAKIIGVERSSIGKYEGKSKVIPSDDIKARIAEYFRVSVDYLLGLEQNSMSPSESFSEFEQEILSIFRSINDSGREYMLNNARWARDNPDFRKGGLSTETA